MRPPTFNGAFPLIKLGRCFHGFVIRGLDHKHFSYPSSALPSLLPKIHPPSKSFCAKLMSRTFVLHFGCPVICLNLLIIHFLGTRSGQPSPLFAYPHFSNFLLGSNWTLSPNLRRDIYAHLEKTLERNIQKVRD